MAVVSVVSTAALPKRGPTHRRMTPHPSVQPNWNGAEISQTSSHFYFIAFFRHLLWDTILCSREAFLLDSHIPSCCRRKKKHTPPSMSEFRLESKHLLISFIFIYLFLFF